MAAACRRTSCRMAVDPKLLERIDYDLPLDPNFDLGVGDWLRSSSEEDELVVLSWQTFQKSESFRLVSKRSVSL